MNDPDSGVWEVAARICPDRSYHLFMCTILQEAQQALDRHRSFQYSMLRLTNREWFRGKDHMGRRMRSDATECNCPTPRCFARRIEALVKDKLIAPDIAERLKSKNQADKNYRARKVWFCFFPPRNAGEHGIKRFFRHWGGEALYVCHENDPLTSHAISCIGLPRIV